VKKNPFMRSAKEIIDRNLVTIDALRLPEMSGKNIQAEVLRLDKIHPVISGNKWFKLKYYLAEAAKRDIKTLITFGGAYSNHIIATAYASKELGIKSLGIIRGEAPGILSPTLRAAREYGMHLIFISRGEYRKKDDSPFTSKLLSTHPGSLIIPEGGAGAEGVRGSAEILDLTNSDRYSHILCAVGTATTFTGLAQRSGKSQRMIGISVLKGGNEELLQQLEGFIDKEKMSYCQINPDYHFGGYAKPSEPLFGFMNALYKETGIPTDFVYTGKLFFAVADLIKKDLFPPASRLLIIHSGGLQGNDSLPRGTLNF
jgi:1-aminocyclopropane-1-carboxylate deaminase